MKNLNTASRTITKYICYRHLETLKPQINDYLHITILRI